MTDSTPALHEYEYKAEMKQLLHLIIHSLYTHPEVFLRELISNASDALNKVRFLQLSDSAVLEPDAPLRIAIDIDKETHTFSITDSGIGMTKDDLIDRIGTVASSGTLEFVSSIKAGNAPLDGDLIGRFGVGFYSAFMVADEVTIETRHADPGSQGYRWKSVGEGRFTIEEIDLEHRGTRISFTLKEDAKEFSEDWRVRGIIKKYSNFVDFPILIAEEQVNTVTALWHRASDAVTEEERNEFYTFLSNDPDPPLGHLHLHIEGRYSFNALLFIPRTAPPRLYDLAERRSLHLYASKVFIQDDCRELAPEYLSFITGVIDSEDLPLNVSREVTQASPVLAKINEVVTSRVLGLLDEWSKSEPEKYATFFSAFGSLLKMGATSDFTNRERILELLRFETTKTEPGTRASFRDYVSRMQAEQKDIYYLVGEHRDLLERSPNLEYFRKNDLEVLLLSDPVDVFSIPAIFEFDSKRLVSIEKADLNIPADAETPAAGADETDTAPLLAYIKEQLGDAVEDVVASKRLVDSAATLVAGKKGMDAQMERVMKLMDKEYSGSKRILELNLAHPLIRNLARLHASGADEALVKDCVQQIYQGASLIENTLDAPADFVRRMTEIMERATR